MFSKLNIYLVLKANFNSKFMFSKLNIQFTEHSVSELYSTRGLLEAKEGPAMATGLARSLCHPLRWDH